MKKLLHSVPALLLALALMGCVQIEQPSVPTEDPIEQTTQQPVESTMHAGEVNVTENPIHTQTENPGVPTDIELSEVMRIPAFLWNLGSQIPEGADDCLRYYADANIEAPADYCVHDGKLYVLDTGNDMIRCYSIENGNKEFDIYLPDSSMWVCEWCGDSLYVLDNDKVLRIIGPDSYEPAFSIKDNYPEISEFKTSIEYQVAMSGLPSGESIPAGFLEYNTRQLTSMHSFNGALYLNFTNTYTLDSGDSRTAHIYMKYADGSVSTYEGTFAEGLLDHEEYYMKYAPLLGLPTPYAYPLSGAASIPLKQDDSTGEFYLMHYFEDYAVFYNADINFEE